ncbi:E3 ubiquitin-protein ligase HIP1 [Carex littledalei]|uniref:RING-type E3 ubiquitin transferase n=1 Tax=Carex littledalei TaxID=544730 RepID=A0A833QTU2_9POAL|nr:E3 ubiquitin-protein ligase HIP1 [Carex littledalei]
MQRGGRDNELISFLEFCNSTSNLQVDLNFPDDVLAVAQGDPLQNDVGQVDLNFPDDVLDVAQGDPLQNDVGQVDLNFPDDVLVIAQSDPLQNDTSLENRNLIQNPNPSLLNPYPNQYEEHGLFLPFEGMHLHPNLNNLMEPQYQPYYQLNPELCMPSNQNYMARPPCPYTNVTNVASISRGATDISRSSRRRRDGITMNRPTYNGTGNSASEPMQQNIEGFVRNTRMRVDPGQGRTSMVAVSRTTAQYNVVFSGPNPNPGQPMSNPDLASNTLSIPLARINTTLPGQGRTSMVAVSRTTAQYNVVFSGPNPNPGQPMSSRVLASNALSIPLARPNPYAGQLITLAFNPHSIPLAGGSSIPRPNLSPLQIIPETAPAPATAGRVTSQSWPVALPSSDHEVAQFRAFLVELEGLAYQRTTSHQQPIRAIASSDASQIRSQGVSLHQAVPVPTIPSVPASSALSVSVPEHTASTSQTGNNGAWVVFQERPSSLPPIRTRLPRSTSGILALHAQARLNRYREARNLVRNLHPDADERELVTLLSGTREMLDEWREIDRHFDMRLDTDHMSHEELVALAERIGSVSTGVSEEIVNERMTQRPFSGLLENETDPCCICQEEYVEDDQVGTLDCGHNFHRESLYLEGINT